MGRTDKPSPLVMDTKPARPRTTITQATLYIDSLSPFFNMTLVTMSTSTGCEPKWLVTTPSPGLVCCIASCSRSVLRFLVQSRSYLIL